MLWNSSSIRGFAIHASDGDLGAVTDILFEDSNWTARWLEVDTGNWLPGRKVLIPCSALNTVDRSLGRLSVNLTQQQVKDSPESDTHKTVSRQHEVNIYEFYGLGPYWGGGLYPLSNAIAVPFQAPLPPDMQTKVKVTPPRNPEDPHLRSVETVIGYHIHATDGEIGHVADFLIDDETWVICYLKVDTRNWWPGRQVLLSPELVKKISWSEELIHVTVDRQKVKDSPEYQDQMTVDGAYDEKMRAYYSTGYLGMM